jgi:hypothetical protein
LEKLYGCLALALACSSPQTPLLSLTTGSSGSGTGGHASAGSTTASASSSGSSSTAGGSTSGGGSGCTLFAPAVQVITGVGPSYSPMSVPPNGVNHPLAVGALGLGGNWDIAIGDLGNGDTPDFGILKGNGDGSFQPTVHVGVGRMPSGALIGVFPGEVIPRLAVADSWNQKIGVFDFSTGSLDRVATLSSPLGCYFNRVAYLSMADFKHTGWLDVLLGSDGTGNCGSSATLFVSSGAGWTTPWASTDAELPPTYGDFDSDGILDLVMATGSLSGLAFLRGRGDGTFDSPVGIDTAVHAMAWSGDLNGDGHLDLVESSATAMTVLLGVGDGTFKVGPPTSLSAVSVSAQLIDLNGDGRLDFVGTDWSSQYVHVALGNGDGTFQPEVMLPIADPSGIAAAGWVTIGDMNNDGRPDLIVGDVYDGNVSVFLNTCRQRP